MIDKLTTKMWILLFLFICTTGIFADPYKLSPDYRPIKITIYWAGMDEEREHTSYEYNKKGQLIKASIFRGGDSAAWYDSYEYDKDNKLQKKSSFNSTGLVSYTTYTFINNRLYEEAEFDKDGNYKRVEQYERDNKGNLFSRSVKQIPYNSKTLVWNSLIFYSYNQNQTISESFEYYNGTLLSKTSYGYSDSSLILESVLYGDNRDVTSKGIKTFTYFDKGKNKGKIKELVNNYLYLYDGKEHIECCTAYSMIPGYGPAGNMTSLSFYNCEKVLSGRADIIWEKGKTEMMLIEKIFEQIHWFFTGC